MWCFLVCLDGLRLTSSVKVGFFGFALRFLDFVVCMSVLPKEQELIPEY